MIQNMNPFKPPGSDTAASSPRKKTAALMASPASGPNAPSIAKLVATARSAKKKAKSRKLDAASLTRSAMTIPQLKRLEAQFADGDLTEPQFVKKFQSVIPELTEPQLVELFLKIDANADGCVSWDETTSYMFVHASDPDANPDTEGGIDDPSNSCERFMKASDLHATFNDPSKRYHKNQIVRILYVRGGGSGSRGTYLTASSDGTVQQWDASTFTHRGQLLQRENPIQDIVVLPISKKLVVAEAYPSISFHDMNSGSEYTRISGPRLHQARPTCMYTYFDGAQHEWLFLGDDAGSIHIFGLRNRMWQIKDAQVGVHGTHVQKFEHVQRSYAKNIHSEWITQVEFNEDLNAVITSSMDGTIKLSDLPSMLRGQRDCVRHVFSGHKCGVVGFSWSPASRIMISCGVERGPLAWNPFSRASITHIDAGHSSIVAVTLDETRQRIISVDAMNHIYVHSLKNYKLLQELHQRTVHIGDDFIGDTYGSSLTVASKTGMAKRSRGNGEARLPDVLRIGAIYFNDSAHLTGGSLVTGTLNLQKYTLSSDITRGTRDMDAERGAIGTVLYNRAFHQVVSAELDDESSICIWEPSTGDVNTRFSGVHAGSAVTAMTFDAGERRLITGSHDGCELHVFNFGNRVLLSRLVKLPHKTVVRRTGSIDDMIAEFETAQYVDSDLNFDDVKDMQLALEEYSSPRESPTKTNQKRKGNLTIPEFGYSPGTSFQSFPSVTTSKASQISRFKSLRSYQSKDVPVNKLSIIPPPESPVVLGSLLHQSLKKPYTSRSRSIKSSKWNSEPFSHRIAPREDRRKETNSEITRVLYIEQNSGKGEHFEHFIVCTGWDRHIYVFDDDEVNLGRREGGKSIQGYLYKMPKTSQVLAAHTQDVTDIVHCEPMLASCSLDGYIKFWSLQNGEHLGYVNVGSPITKLIAFHDIRLLLASSEDLLFLVRSKSPYIVLGTIRLFPPPYESSGNLNENLHVKVSSMSTTISKTHLAVGDVNGFVFLFSLSASNANIIEPLSSWKAHNDRIMSSCFVESPEQLEIYLITSSEKAELFLWNLLGEKIGTFGSGSTWVTSITGHHNESLIKERYHQKNVDSCKWFSQTSNFRLNKLGEKVDILAEHVTMTTQAGSSDEIRLPAVGEVWVRKHKHEKGDTTDIFEAEEIPQDIITIQRVEKDCVIGWDGNEPFVPKLKHCSLEEFSVKNPHAWHYDAALSGRVDKIFFQDPDNLSDPFKVVCICKKNISVPEINNSQKDKIVVRDHNMMIRELPDRNMNTLTGTMYRSLSEALLHAEGQRRSFDFSEPQSKTEEICQNIGEKISDSQASSSGPTGSPEEVDKNSEDPVESNGEINFSLGENKPEAAMVGWATVSYEKYGHPSMRSKQPNHSKYSRLWASRLDTRRTYRFKHVPLDALARLKSHDSNHEQKKRVPSKRHFSRKPKRN